MMSKQFEQLKLLYTQIFNTSQKIKNLIDKEDFEQIESLENYKSQLVQKVTAVKKTVALSEEENGNIQDLKSEILKSEKENLERIKSMRDKTLTELKKINSQSRISNKYNNNEAVEGSICDYTSD